MNVAASEWLDEQGRPWLPQAPKIRLLPEKDKRLPYPISWEEQVRLFEALPPHLERMALYAVNTGCRDQEICQLRWEWEVAVPDHPDWLIFVIPGRFVKNTDDRLVICNTVAREVVNSQRGKHPTHVFTYRGAPIARILNSAWKRVRRQVNLPLVRVHDLRHTFGRRLRAAGVPFEDRQDLLGHRSGRVTTHYSAPELEKLYQAVNLIGDSRRSGVLLRSLQAEVSRPVKTGSLICLSKKLKAVGSVSV